MRLRTIALISTLVLGLLAVPPRAGAQEPEKVYRIGYLGPRSVNISGNICPSSGTLKDRTSSLRGAFPKAIENFILNLPPSWSASEWM